ncbi:MAG: DUF4011 domain-containing protein [Chloroflexi bacterium]|nr:DUF4011 domain-containing protein [Chloroflexota bacterium]
MQEAHPAGAGAPPASTSPTAHVSTAIDRWQRELLDLSRNNRLLHFQPAGGGGGRSGQRGVPVAQPAAAELFDRLANRERKQTIARPPVAAQQPLDLTDTVEDAPHPQPGGDTPLPRTGKGLGGVTLKRDEILLDHDPARLETLLYRLRLRARSALQEQGIDILYVAFGLLEWTLPNEADRPISPLLLLPVRLDRKRTGDPYTLTPLDEPPILNPALTFQLEQTYRLTLALPDTEADLDYTVTLDALRQSIGEATVARDHGWEIRDGAFLGLFSFAKQAMYADLEANRARFGKHPVVRALAGDPGGLTSLTLPDPVHLDEQEHPHETFQVLDADASQRTVLAAIRKGGNLVVQGPPGTGKSQTIANAIAETLARGKTVLFVSEKLAALQVVAKRLRAAGLGEFCLEAHGHGGDKKAVVTALAGALPQTMHHPAPVPTDDLTLLAERRAALNAYARALHDHHNPLGASAFALHGELAKRASAPRVLFDVPTISALSGEKTMRLLDLGRRLVPLAGVVTAPEQHPWFGCTVQRWNPLVQAQLQTTLDRLATASDELAEVHARASHRWGLAPEPTLSGARWLLQALALLEERPATLGRWLERPDLSALVERVGLWGGRCQGHVQRRLTLLSHYHETLFALDLSSIVAAIERVELGAIARLRGEGPAVDRALGARAAVEQSTARVLRAIPAALDAAAELARPLGMAAPEARGELERALRVADVIGTAPHPTAEWLQPGAAGRLIGQAEEAARQHERARTNRLALLERFDEGVLTAITPEMAERFASGYGSWLRALRPSWYADLGTLKHHLRPEHAAAGLDYEAAQAAIWHWRELCAAEAWLGQAAGALANVFGRHYQGERTDWEALHRSLGAVQALEALLGNVSRWPRVRALLLDEDDPGPLRRPTESLRAALAELDAAMTILERVAGRDLATQNPVSGAERGGGGPDYHVHPLPAVAADLQHWLEALAPLWAASDQLHASRKLTTTSAATLLAEARDALACLTFEAEFGAAMPALADDLGPSFQGLRTEWPRVLTALSWTERMVACFDGRPPAAFVAAVEREPIGPVAERAELHRALGRMQELRAEIGASYGDGGPAIGSRPIDRATLPAIAAWARDRHAALPRLAEWIDARTVTRELESAGLGGFVQALMQETPPPNLWVDAFLKQLFTLWLTWRYDHAPALARFRREGHETLIQEMRTLDRKQWEIAARRIGERLLAQRPPASGVASSQSEVGLLLREGRKQRRFKPLRRLFAEMPTLLPRVKPCLLMSPLSVAQHLGESDVTFDLVIFDEASQILPADAIGAVGRGKQVVVVGDRRQLPPTRFFQVTSLQTADDDLDEEPPESVLDACLNAGVPECSLLWHYRSRHEHLIAFSNAAIYGGRLQTFPSPDADERVVRLHHVPNGVYDRGRTRANAVEAATVADLVVAHVEAQAAVPPEQRQSLGVIAFSEAQMLQILTELEARRRANPDLEPLLADDGADEGLFVKNLEAVQGDERDVILFSVGYGPDADGRLTMSFGPLNLPGGERRLNVAVTRARQQLTVVSSVRAHQIDASPQRPAGLRLLRQYLDYAERGPAAILDSPIGAATGGGAASPFEGAVQAALAAEMRRTPGLERMEVVAGVGVGLQPVDLAVREESGRYVLAIECDGQTFGALPTARDRDRLRQEVLERLGWPLHRVWSTDWLTAQRDEVKRLVAAVERGRQQRDGLLLDDEQPLAVLKPADQPAAGRTRPDVRGAQTALTGAGPATPPTGLTMPPTGLTMPPTGLTMPPTGLTMPPTGLTMPPTGLAGQTPTVPPASQPATRLMPPVVARPIEQVDDGEIAEAIKAVLRRELAMPRDSLVVGVARALGYQRTGSKIRAAVGSVVDREQQRGALAEVGGNLSLAGA